VILTLTTLGECADAVTPRGQLVKAFNALPQFKPLSLIPGRVLRRCTGGVGFQPRLSFPVAALVRQTLPPRRGLLSRI